MTYSGSANPTPQIIGGSSQLVRVITHQSKSDIAVPTQQRPDMPGCVAVIHHEDTTLPAARGWQPADRTQTSLHLHHRVVFDHLQAVQGPQTTCLALGRRQRRRCRVLTDLTPLTPCRGERPAVGRGATTAPLPAPRGMNDLRPAINTERPRLSRLPLLPPQPGVPVPETLRAAGLPGTEKRQRPTTLRATTTPRIRAPHPATAYPTAQVAAHQRPSLTRVHQRHQVSALRTGLIHPHLLPVVGQLNRSVI